MLPVYFDLIQQLAARGGLGEGGLGDDLSGVTKQK
jgi:hypothetical protein